MGISIWQLLIVLASSSCYSEPRNSGTSAAISAAHPWIQKSMSDEEEKNAEQQPLEKQNAEQQAQAEDKPKEKQG